MDLIADKLDVIFSREEQLESLCRFLAEACDLTLRLYYPDPPGDDGMELSPLMEKLRTILESGLSDARKAGIIT